MPTPNYNPDDRRNLGEGLLWTSEERVKVHYRADGAVAAPCGYKYNPRLLGFDFCNTWNKAVAVPVNCLDCLLFYQPKPWKVPSWEGVGKKVRT